MGIWFFPSLCVEKVILSPGKEFGTETHVAQYGRIHFWFVYLIKLVYMSDSLPAPHCLQYCDLVVLSFGIRMYDSLIFVLG